MDADVVKGSHSTDLYPALWRPPGVRAIIAGLFDYFVGLVDDNTVLKYRRYREDIGVDDLERKLDLAAKRSLDIEAQIFHILGAQNRVIKFKGGDAQHGLRLEYAVNTNVAQNLHHATVSQMPTGLNGHSEPPRALLTSIACRRGNEENGYNKKEVFLKKWSYLSEDDNDKRAKGEMLQGMLEELELERTRLHLQRYEDTIRFSARRLKPGAVDKFRTGQVSSYQDVSLIKRLSENTIRWSAYKQHKYYFARDHFFLPTYLGRDFFRGFQYFMRTDKEQSGEKTNQYSVKVLQGQGTHGGKFNVGGYQVGAAKSAIAVIAAEYGVELPCNPQGYSFHSLEEKIPPPTELDRISVPCLPNIFSDESPCNKPFASGGSK
ncbi:MAG: hypothetical protein M1830_003736 [Pleopsidium flavum]|nr:MAG: hypothetical protein M1830_003736 [Pleopsidium flavum]